MIAVDGLTKFYGDQCAVRNVSFGVADGQVVGFLGLNGSGKTTILRVLAGDLEPSAGTVTVGDYDLLGDPTEFRRQVGFLPESVPIYPDMTVDEYLRFVGALRGLRKSTLTHRVNDVCERLAIGSYRTVPLQHLSHGYRKRVGIAAAIVHDPDLVILDEPISGLDPVQIVEMRALVRSLAGDHTVLVSSHILTEISHTCDSILVLSDGHIVARGTEQEISRPHRDVRRINVTVRAAPETAIQHLKSVDTVADVQVVSQDDDTCQLIVEASSDVREAMVFALAKANIGVLRLDRAVDELEEAFVALTKPSESTESAT